MKRAIILGFFLAFYSANAQELLNIYECYRLARENYPMIKQFDLIKESEKYDLENAAKGYLPQFSINANALYLSDSPNIGGGGGIPQGQYRANIIATQVLWDGGDISAKKQMTKAQARAELENNEVILYELNDRVNKLFFGMLIQNESLRQNYIYQKDIQTVIDSIEAMIKNGVSNDYDLSLMKVEQLNAKQAETEITATRGAYARMLSLLINREVTPTTILEKPKGVEILKQEINRPELGYYSAREDYYEAKKDTIDAGLMPKISLFGLGGYGRSNFSSLRDEEFYGLGGINFSWSFGNFYTKTNEKLKIMASKKSVRTEAETFLFNTRLSMIQEDGEIQRIAELLEKDIKIVVLRRNIKEIAFSRMKNGTISVTDFIRELNAKELAEQKLIYRGIEKLSREYNHKYLTNN